MLCAMPVTVRIDGLGELLDRQFSVASRGQLLELGMKDTAMRWRTRAGGPWQTLLPGVYLGLTGAPNLLQKEMAALLYAGPGSLVTGPMALMHHGLRSPVVLETVDLLVPAGRQRHSTEFVRLHRTYRLPSRFVASGPVRFVQAARAVADTARMLGDVRDVRAVVADAVQRDRCTVAGLAAEVKEGPVRGSATFRSVLGEVAEGIRSAAEGTCGISSGPRVCRRRCTTRRCTQARCSSPGPMRGGRRPGWQRKRIPTSGTCRPRTRTGRACVMTLCARRGSFRCIFRRGRSGGTGLTWSG